MKKIIFDDGKSRRGVSVDDDTFDEISLLVKMKRLIKKRNEIQKREIVSIDRNWKNDKIDDKIYKIKGKLVLLYNAKIEKNKTDGGGFFVGLKKIHEEATFNGIIWSDFHNGTQKSPEFGNKYSLCLHWKKYFFDKANLPYPLWMKKYLIMDALGERCNLRFFTPKH